MKYIEDLKHICLREFRHISNSYDVDKRSVGYCYKRKSRSYEAIILMIKWGWLECTEIDAEGNFMYVKPQHQKWTKK